MKYLPIVLLFLFALSCKTKHEIQTEYVYIEKTDTLNHLRTQIDSLLRESTRKDSINVRDSIVIREKGDTVIVERWHTEYREKDSQRAEKEKEIIKDTVYQTHTEYVDKYIDREVIKEVPRALSWWQKTLMWLGVAFFAILLFNIILIIRMRK